MSFCLAEFLSCWLADPQLFLYAKGTAPDDVHLWRCKKPTSSSSSSSLVVPMKFDDFDYVSNVKNHRKLIGDIFDWDEIDYKRLVKYVYEKRLLVNGQGFVIAELHKAGNDGNKTNDDANEKVPAIYIRSLDVLALKPYIPNLMERPIPLRTVKYLGDVNGKAAMMEEDSNVTKLTAGLVAITDRVDDLESKNNTLKKILEGKITKLTADLATQMDALTTLQRQLNRVLENAHYKEVWMNDFTSSEWVGIQGLNLVSMNGSLLIIGPQGTFTKDENITNVRARYWYKIKTDVANIVYEYKVICLEDLTPSKERARFSQKNWVASFESQGKTYIISDGVGL